jgi:hypothetical protein
VIDRVLFVVVVVVIVVVGMVFVHVNVIIHVGNAAFVHMPIVLHAGGALVPMVDMVFAAAYRVVDMIVEMPSGNVLMIAWIVAMLVGVATVIVVVMVVGVTVVVAVLMGDATLGGFLHRAEGLLHGLVGPGDRSMGGAVGSEDQFLGPLGIGALVAIQPANEATAPSANWLRRGRGAGAGLPVCAERATRCARCSARRRTMNIATNRNAATAADDTSRIFMAGKGSKLLHVGGTANAVELGKMFRYTQVEIFFHGKN